MMNVMVLVNSRLLTGKLIRVSSVTICDKVMVFVGIQMEPCIKVSGQMTCQMVQVNYFYPTETYSKVFLKKGVVLMAKQK